MIVGNNQAISVQGAILMLAAFTCQKGAVAAQSVDMTPFQTGNITRVYLDNNLQLRVNPREDMFWQLAEMVIPAPQSNHVQQGTLPVDKLETVMIVRGENDFDAVPDLEEREIVSVGHGWQNYQPGSEWQPEEDGVRWIGERAPQAGEEYPVEVKTVIQAPNMVSEIVPLDLEEITIQVFDNPA